MPENKIQLPVIYVAPRIVDHGEINKAVCHVGELPAPKAPELYDGDTRARHFGCDAGAGEAAQHITGLMTLDELKEIDRPKPTEPETAIRAAALKRLRDAIHMRRMIDPMRLYCAKTGQAIGSRDQGALLTALEYAGDAAIIEALDTAHTACAPQWLNTSPEALDVLIDKDTAAYVVYCLAVLTRKQFTPRKPDPKLRHIPLARNVTDEFYWSKARAYRTIASMSALDQYALALKVNVACTFTEHAMNVLAREIKDLAARSPDGLAAQAKAGTLIPKLDKALANTLASIYAQRNAETGFTPAIEIAMTGPSNIRKTRASRRSRKQQGFDIAIRGIMAEIEPQGRSMLEREIEQRSDAAGFALFDVIENDRKLKPLGEFSFDLDDDEDESPENRVTMRRMSLEEYAREALEKYHAQQTRDKAMREAHAASVANVEGKSMLDRVFEIPKPAPIVEPPKPAQAAPEGINPNSALRRFGII